jgi:hypothetical protein
MDGDSITVSGDSDTVGGDRDTAYTCAVAIEGRRAEGGQAVFRAELRTV